MEPFSRWPCDVAATEAARADTIRRTATGTSREWGMDLGAFSFNTDRTIPAHQLAVACEERGFESVWLPEHTHMPVLPLDTYPGYPGGTLPEAYLRMSDPVVGLAAAAALTTTIKLGTGILLLNQHDLFAVAKQLATLDRLSGGRLVVGVGAGWNRPEMQNHGVAPERRWDVLAERVEALKALWTAEEASYDGEFVKFGPVWSYPKPQARPHPPLLLGSTISQRARRFVVDHCDGWLPVGGMIADLPGAVAEVYEHARRTGRDPAAMEISVLCIDQPDIDALERYRDLGATRTLIGVAEAGPDAALTVLDRYAELIPKFA